MPFTPKDRAQLATHRKEVERLEKLEEAALLKVSVVLHDCGLEPRGDIQWITICENADAIRDALEPFDSGVREGKA